MSIGQIVFQWIDLIWIPIVLITVDKRHWFKALGFILACILALRLQIELMFELRLPYGLLPFLDSPLFTRGLIVYGTFIVLYILLSKYYVRFDPFVFLAASLSLFGIAFIVSSFFILL
ncbi:MAG: hypothetical protein AAF569_02065 [Pseudomonadota bacterium]